MIVLSLQDQVLSVRARAMQLQDKKLASQLSALYSLRDFLPAWSRMKAMLSSKDIPFVTDDGALAAKKLRSGIQAVMTLCADTSIIHPDKAFADEKEDASESSSAKRLDGVCKYDFAVMLKSAVADMDAVRDKWASMVETCVTELQSSSVEGWEIKKDELANDTQAAAALVCNPKYEVLHENNELLNKILPKIKSVAQDGGPIMFEPQFFEKAENVQRHSTLTVLHSYVLMQIMDSIPAMKSPAGRQKALQVLKDEVGAKMFDGKKSPLGKSVLERVKSLASGTEFERVDFLAMMQPPNSGDKADAASASTAV